MSLLDIKSMPSHGCQSVSMIRTHISTNQRKLEYTKIETQNRREDVFVNNLLFPKGFNGPPQRVRAKQGKC